MLTEDEYIKAIRLGASEVYLACEINDDDNVENAVMTLMLEKKSKVEAIKTGKPVESSDNKHTLRGKRFEPEIFEFYKKNSEHKVREQKNFYYKRRGEDDFDLLNLIMARPDGLIEIESDVFFPLEIKCPEKQYDSIPIKYYVQMQVQMMVMGDKVTKGHFLSVSPKNEDELDWENKLLYIVERDQKLIDEIFKRVTHYFTYFMEDMPDDKILKIPKRIHPSHIMDKMKVEKVDVLPVSFGKNK